MSRIDVKKTYKLYIPRERSEQQGITDSADRSPHRGAGDRAVTAARTEVVGP